ncbi:hypothetical protein ACYU03_12165 [Pseudomonas sp. X10]
MKYLLLALASYALTYYLVGLLIQGRLNDVAEGLRHRPDAPPPGQYLREVAAQARRARLEYTALAGSLLAVVLGLLAWLFG